MVEEKEKSNGPNILTQKVSNIKSIVKKLIKNKV